MGREDLCVVFQLGWETIILDPWSFDSLDFGEEKYLELHTFIVLDWYSQVGSYQRGEMCGLAPDEIKLKRPSMGKSNVRQMAQMTCCPVCG